MNNNNIQEIAALLSQLAALVQTVDIMSLTEDELSTLLEDNAPIRRFLEKTHDEAIRRISEDGMYIPNFDVRIVDSRSIFDIDGAIRALSANYPKEVVDRCVQTKLVSFKELGKLIGKSAVNDILSPYMEMKPMKRLVKLSDDENNEE